MATQIIPGGERPITLPHNIEAEQGLLGAIMLDNAVYDRVAGMLRPEHFFDPLHGRIFDVMGQRIVAGKLTTAVTLRPYFENDPAIQELPVKVGYLAALAGAAVSVSSAHELGEMIRELANLRDLYRIGKDIAAQAVDVNPDSKSETLITEAERALYQLAEKGQYQRGFVTFAEALKSAVSIVSANYQRGGKLAGLSSGFIDMDRKLGGLHPSDLLILAGRPSMGKTALATNIAFNVARRFKMGTREDGTIGAIDGGVVGFFSLEMSAEQLATRILSEQSEIPSEKFRRGELSEDEFRRFVEAAAQLERIPLYIDDTPALPVAALAARARRMQRQHGLDLLIVDYLQLMRGSRTSGDNRVQEVSEITQGLKAIAKELNVPVIALSQLSRQVESRDDKRPQLNDLRESGSIEQDADVVMFVYREEYYVARAEPASDSPNYGEWQKKMEACYGKAEVILAKQRHGPIGKIEMSFDSRFTRFGDLAHPSQAGELNDY